MKTIILPQKECNGNRLRLPSPHRDTLRAALTLSLRKYRGFGCSLMHSFCGRIWTDHKKQRISPAYSRKHPPPINSLTNDVFGTYSLPIPTK